MAGKATTYRAVLVGLAIIIIAFIAYFIYKAVVGTKQVIQNSPINQAINPTGAGQSIRENAPISNQPAPASSSGNIVPVGGSSSNSSNSASGGSVPSGYDTANNGPANGTSPCNAYGSLKNPTCQAQQVYPTK